MAQSQIKGTSQIHDQHLTHPEHESHVRSYVIVFALLLVLLGATVGAAFIDFHEFLPGHFWNMSIAASIAIAKAVLIILFFMHVKTGPRRVVVFAMGGFLWLALMIALFMADYTTRTDENYPNYKGEPRMLHFPGQPLPGPTPPTGKAPVHPFYGPAEPGPAPAATPAPHH